MFILIEIEVRIFYLNLMWNLVKVWSKHDTNLATDLLIDGATRQVQILFTETGNSVAPWFSHSAICLDVVGWCGLRRDSSSSSKGIIHLVTTS